MEKQLASVIFVDFSLVYSVCSQSSDLQKKLKKLEEKVKHEMLAKEELENKCRYKYT